MMDNNYYTTTWSCSCKRSMVLHIPKDATLIDLKDVEQLLKLQINGLKRALTDNTEQK